MTQTSLFDPLAGAAGKEKGMADAARGAGEPWLAWARAVVLQVASSRLSFTSDSVWAAGLAKPREPRALGAVMNKLAREGLIRKTGTWTTTTQASRHNAPVTVWERGGK